MLSNSELCELCGEPMPFGESMFKFHGYSGPCPKPPLPEKLAQSPEMIRAERDALAKEVEQLKISNENLKTTIGYWWPKLGYSKFNEMVYPALDDHRATEAPAFTERDRLRSKLEVAREFFKKIAAHQVSMGAPNSFAATEARTALAQIGEGHEGA